MKPLKIRYVSVFIQILFFIFSSIVLAQPNRESWQSPVKIMDAVGIKAGMKIGEAGAGTGFFTIPLAERVGSKGKVYANDISRYSLNRLKSKYESEGIKNIEIIIGDSDDPLFPDKNMDKMIMVYVLHHIHEQRAFLKNLKKYFNENTELIIIERNADKDRTNDSDFMSKKQVLETMRKAEYKLIKTYDFLKYDTIYVYKSDQ